MDTRQKILNAAADLILEEGLDATRVSKIAKRAGLTDGALYRHFDNKDDLLAEVYLDIAREIEDYAKRFSQQKGTAEERFTGFLEDLFGSFLQQPERLILFETLNRAVSIKKENEAGALEQTFNLLTNLLNEAKANKLIRRDIHNDIIIAAVYGSLSQLVRESFQKLQGIKKADLREVLNIFWQGLQ